VLFARFRAETLESECYAYVRRSPGSPYRYETMKEHVDGMIKYLREKWEYLATLQKFERLLGVDRDVLDVLIKLAIILHDIGKSRREYQETCTISCESFPYHYAISSRIAMRIARSADLGIPRIKEIADITTHKPPLGALYLSVVVLPVLLHHYTTISEETLFEAIEKSRPLRAIEIHEPCRELYVQEFRALLEHSKKFRDAELIRLLEKAHEMLSTSNIIELSSLPLNSNWELIRTYSTQSPLITLVEVVTGLVNMSDSKIACIHREERFGLRECK